MKELPQLTLLLARVVTDAIFIDAITKQVFERVPFDSSELDYKYEAPNELIEHRYDGQFHYYRVIWEDREGYYRTTNEGDEIMAPILAEYASI